LEKSALIMIDNMLYPIGHTSQSADSIAFRMCSSQEEVTFGQLEARSNQVAHLLRDCGVEIGEHIAIVLKNQREFLEICFGAERAGIYYTTISTRLTASEISFIVSNCGAKVLICGTDLVELVQPLRNDSVSSLRFFSVGARLPGWESWSDALAVQPSTRIADEAQGLDMLYSSGTTGQPKGVKWPRPEGIAGQRTFLVELLDRLYSYGEQCRYLSPAPLYHAAPLRHSMTTIKLGGEVSIMEQFDPEQSLALIERYRITHSQWVPTMFVRMLKLSPELREKYDLSSMRMVVHAAAPCPVDVKHQMIQWWGPIIHEYYAGTENNGFCSITCQQWLEHIGSVGQAALGTLHICDDNGCELAIGETGQVYFSDGPDFSYHNDPHKTAQTRNEHGWSTLGDIGRLDSEGYLYLVDRKAFMIISGGVNIYPQEVESILICHPKVADVAVFGIPNADFGEEVKAVVQLIDPALESEQLAQELIAFCRQHIADFKCPRSVDFEFELPRHPTGKLYKKILRDRYWQKNALDI
jgi:fatty-acyl-CoA synthase